MKRLLLAAAFAGCTVVFGQKQIFRYAPPAWGRINTSLLTDDNTNNLYLIVAHPDFVERIRLGQGKRENMLHQGAVPNEDFVVNAQPDDKTQRLFFDNKYTDACVSGSEMIELLLHQWTYADFIFVETDLASGRSVSTDTVRMQRAGDLLFTWRKARALCLLEKPKNKPYFLVREKAFGRRVKTDTIRIELPAIGKTDNKLFSGGTDGFSEVNFGNDVQILPNNLWLPVFGVKHRNKAFVQKDKFQVVLNADNLQTWLLTIDLNGLQYSVKKFESPVSGLKNRQALSNAAFVIDSFLVTGFCSDKNLYWAIHNIYTDSLLQAKVINTENFAAVSAGPALKVGDFWREAIYRKSVWANLWTKQRIISSL